MSEFNTGPVTEEEEAEAAEWLEREFGAEYARNLPSLLSLDEQRGVEEIAGLQQDRNLRERYAKAFFSLLAAQLAFLNILVVCLGLGHFTYSDWLFHTYLVGTFGQIVTIVIVVVRNLFPRRDDYGDPTKRKKSRKRG